MKHLLSAENEPLLEIHRKNHERQAGEISREHGSPDKIADLNIHLYDHATLSSHYPVGLTDGRNLLINAHHLDRRDELGRARLEQHKKVARDAILAALAARNETHHGEHLGFALVKPDNLTAIVEQLTQDCPTASTAKMMQ